MTGSSSAKGRFCFGVGKSARLTICLTLTTKIENEAFIRISIGSLTSISILQPEYLFRLVACVYQVLQIH